MKKFILYVFVLIMVVAGYTSAHAAANFTGTWVLDIEKSDLGMSNPAAKARMNKVTLVIKQTATQLTIERSTGDIATYNLDGSESINNLPNGMQSKTTINWVGNALAAKTVSQINGMETKMTDERSLSADGKQMTLKVALTTPNGGKNQLLIYNKQ
jgi:hypothetical protein